MDTALKDLWTFLPQVAQNLGMGAIVFIYGLHREWWVMGGQYRAVARQRDRFADLADVNGKVAETGLEMARR